MNIHFLWLGILLGMGAAIPVGPVNLEIIRRNLRFGTPYGIVTGLGACSADVTYLILLCIGALTLLQYPAILHGLGFVGSLILAWFAYNAFRSPIRDAQERESTPSLFRYSIEGFLITLINPYTILFWVSISSQISLVSMANPHAMLFAGLGVVMGTVGWVLSLNGMLHFTRHKLSTTTIKWLNYLGGVILLGFATVGLLRSLTIL